jgi:phenylpropionate dioxygenase-like ring-hydroxylating dioxygenase large terminal subunit
MFDEKVLNKVVASVDRELARTAYPTDFPVLPPIPAARYSDPEFFKLEQEHLFRKTWIWAATHVSDLPQNGSYKLFDQLGESIIISRGKDDVIRAFKNSCRHRGSALLFAPSGRASRFICPYHAWGYSLEGELKSVPEERDFACLDKASLSLLQVRCEVWNGFVFINFDDHAAPLAEFMAPLTEKSENFPFENFELKECYTKVLDCNWKVALDNFIEIYHVNTVHVKTLVPILDTHSFAPSLLANGHGCFATKKKSASVYGDVGLKDDAVGADDLTNMYTIALSRFPNSMTALDPNGINWLNFWPLAPDRTLLMAGLMGPKMEDAAQDTAYLTMLREANVAILAEDVDLFAGVQRSIDKGDLKQLIVGYQEQCLYWYHEEIDRVIGPDRVPEALRMKPLLGSYLGRSV